GWRLDRMLDPSLTRYGIQRRCDHEASVPKQMSQLQLQSWLAHGQPTMIFQTFHVAQQVRLLRPNRHPRVLRFLQCLRTVLNRAWTGHRSVQSIREPVCLRVQPRWVAAAWDAESGVPQLPDLVQVPQNGS